MPTYRPKIMYLLRWRVGLVFTLPLFGKTELAMLNQQCIVVGIWVRMGTDLGESGWVGIWVSLGKDLGESCLLPLCGMAQLLCSITPLTCDQPCLMYRAACLPNRGLGGVGRGISSVGISFG